MNQLPIFLNLRDRTVILIGEGEMADAKRRLYKRAGALITEDESAAAALAVVALEDDDEAHNIAARLKQRGLLVNVVDRPELCDFTTPAIIDRDPVLVAIGTGGASAGLAKALRQRLEQLLPETLGALASEMQEARDAIKARWTDGAERRRAIDDAFQTSGPLDPFNDYVSASVQTWLTEEISPAFTGVIEIVLNSADPDDLTIRQARLLGQADRIFSGPEVPQEILSRARADAQRFDISERDDTIVQDLTLLIRMQR